LSEHFTHNLKGISQIFTLYRLTPNRWYRFDPRRTRRARRGETVKNANAAKIYFLATNL
jgi:hypothetical protein